MGNWGRGRMLLQTVECSLSSMCQTIPHEAQFFYCVEPYNRSCHSPRAWEKLRMPQKSWVCNGIFFLLLIGQYPFSQLRKTSQDIWQGITMSLKARRMPHESAMRGTAHEDFLHYVYWPKISSKPLNNEKGRHSILMMSFMMKTISVVC